MVFCCDMPTSDTPSPTRIFKANFKKAFGQYRKVTGESLSLFGERHFGGGKTIYNWLRRLWDEGSPFKREGQSNHERLKKLHVALGVSWPSLWEEPRQIGAELLERLTRMLASDRGVEVEKAVAEVLDQLEYGPAKALLAQLEIQHPDLYKFVMDNSDPNQFMPMVAKLIAKHGFEESWLGFLRAWTEAYNSNFEGSNPSPKQDESPDAVDVSKAETVMPAKPVPPADDIMYHGMREERNGKSWWSEYVEDLDDEETAFASLPQKWAEYAATENDPSVAGFWKSWQFGATELSPKEKLLAAVQKHPDWDRFVEKIGSVDGAIARAQNAIGSNDKFLAEKSPNYSGRWAEKLLLKELGN